MGSLGLASLLCGCGGEGSPGTSKPRSDLERRLQPAPGADLPRTVEEIADADEDPGAPWVFRWPLRDIDVTSPYGIRMHPVVHHLLFHSGIDFRADRGTPVLASGPGTVSEASDMPLTGLTVVLHHPGRLATLYAHLDEILVFPGEGVEAGAPIGLIGSTGRSTGPHLHFGAYWLRREGPRHPLDPSELVGTVIDPRRDELPPLPPPPRPREEPGQ